MEWAYKKLGDVCDFQNGFAFKSKFFTDSGFPILRISNIQDGRVDLKRIAYTDTSHYKENLERYKVEKDDLLIAMSGATTGKIGINHTEMTFLLNQRVGKFIPKMSLDKDYLFYYLSTKVQEHLLISAGAAQPNLSTEQIKSIQIPLPPIPEQQRIVAILDQAFADIEKARANAEKNLKNARELFDSYAQNIFTQKKDGWLERSLGELGKVSMCKRILKKQTSASGEIPFYKIGTFGKTANAFIDSDLYEDYKTRFSFPKVGDILISASGTIGRCVVYDGQPAYFQDSNIVWIDNNERLVLNEYLLHFYKVCDWNPSKGATISRLYNDDLKKIKIAFPSKSEQLRVSKDISELNKKILSLQLIYEKKLASLDELKKSLLQKAFSGELTQSKGIAV